MDTNEDAELASEMVVLLGRELKATRRRITELETQLAEKGSGKETSECHEQEAPRQILDEKNFIKRIEALEVKLVEQQEEMTAVETAHGVALERAEVAEIALKDHVEITEENLGRIQDLEGDLVKYKDKYKATRDAKRILRHTCQELEAQLESTKEEHRRAAISGSHQEEVSDGKEPANDEGQEIEEDEEEIEAEEEEEMDLHRDDFRRFLSRLHRPASRPKYHLLQPICEEMPDLRSYLVSTAGSLCPQDILYFPKRVRWQSRKCHAITFSPFQAFVADRWIDVLEFSSLYGEIRELFSLRGSSVYYVGTYKCIGTKDWFPDGVKMPKDISWQTILDITQISKAQRSPIGRLYGDGVLKVQCMVLQCIDFNHGLYNKLLKHKPADASLKRKAEPDSCSKKKAKIMA